MCVGSRVHTSTDYAAEYDISPCHSTADWGNLHCQVPGPSLQVIVNDSSLFLNRTGPGAVKSQLPFLFVAVHGIASEQLVI